MVTAFANAHDDKGSFTAGEGEVVARVGHEATCSDRKCLVTGEVKPKSQLLRFVLDPEKRVVPDVAGRLPGRGLWVCADRQVLQTAIDKKLFARAAKGPVKAEADLACLAENLLAKRCLDLLGLARGAGAVVTGQPQVEEALKSGRLAYVLMAADAGADVQKKLARADIVFPPLSREQLGAALGRDQLVAIGLYPHALAETLRTELTRWQGVRITETRTNAAKECETT